MHLCDSQATASSCPPCTLDTGYTDGYAGDVPNWWRLCSLMWAAVQRWPGVERITIDPRWHVDEDDFGSGTIEAELVG